MAAALAAFDDAGALKWLRWTREEVRPACSGHSKLQVSSDTLMRIDANGPGLVSDTAFDLEIRTRLPRLTYQFPDEAGFQCPNWPRPWTETWMR